MKDGGKRQKATEMRKDRKSSTGMSGSPKKGGHGGKYRWIGHGYDLSEMENVPIAMDPKDPNFAEIVSA